MNARKLLLPLMQTARRVPGYRRLRTGVVLRLRRSTIGRRAVRVIYPDLADPSEVQALLMTHSRSGEQLTIEHDAHIQTLQQEHRTELDQLRQQLTAERTQHVATLQQEHRDKLSRAKAAWERTEPEHRQAGPAISAGFLVAGVYLGARPLILFDVRGVDGETAGAVLEQIAVEQVLGCAFRPMFLSDLSDASVWRKYGHLCEQVPSESGWGGVVPFEEYLTQRLESIRHGLDVRWYLSVPPTGLTQTQRASLRWFGR